MTARDHLGRVPRARTPDRTSTPGGTRRVTPAARPASDAKPTKGAVPAAPRGAQGQGASKGPVPPQDPGADRHGTATPEGVSAAALAQRPDASDKEAPRPTQRLSTGVRRLDTLLDGGFEPGAFVLLRGPPFIGKEFLARLAVVTAVRSGTPCILITTNATAAEARSRLERIDPGVLGAVEKGLLHFVDCYSRSIDAEEDTPGVRFVEGPMDLPGIIVAVNDIQRRLRADHDRHLMVMDSLSTIIAYANAQAAFRFLQVLLGKGHQAGATSVVLMDQGMHSESEVQMIKHLMNGSIDVRDHNDKTQLKVLGIGSQEGLGWVDYQFHKDRFQVTGSFAAGRIR